ncbi:DUF3151 domain-containing protein [Oerskovia paurometabola]|uniref:DUF3151 domain-containing protein n=1 Tax=Oerskovia paurometabola TaxID=162170 RepID=A0ABW1X5U5_9CELL|nr:DUF3151 domain-containing protein [Oerskovia paurometabola]MBM7495915.1 hypothetical protein [Oerskovia paurometabola]
MSHAPTHRNLLDGPAPVRLPAEPDVDAAIARGDDAFALASAFPASSLPWALLAEATLRDGDEHAAVTAYAFARTGYHRGLDALRRAGWRGQGPIPADHVPNQGFLRALLALSRAASLIGEDGEAERCAQFLVDSGTSAEEVAALAG